MATERKVLIRPIDVVELTEEQLHMLGAGVTTVEHMTREEFAKRFPPA